MLRITIWLLTAIMLMSSSCEDVQQHNTPSPTFDYEVLTPKSINYGSDSIQFGDLRLPETDTLVPLIMIIHGGCWLSSYHLDLMDSMAHELTIQGYATWNIEYRRVIFPRALMFWIL